MPQLLDRDREFAEALRREQVLQDVDGHRLDLSAGVILVPCADGDQMPDIYHHQAGLQTTQRLGPRPHILALNGGALVIASDSPLNYGEGDILIRHIQDARRLKGIDVVALYVHAPCGAAGLANLGLETVLLLLMMAKERIKAECDGVRVACFVHMDWGDRKRTYFVSRADWLHWIERRRD